MTALPAEDLGQKMRQHCWDQAMYTFGTAAIFENRMPSLQTGIRVNQFLGVAVVAGAGGLAMALNGQLDFTVMLTVLGVLSTVFLGLNIWTMALLT